MKVKGMETTISKLTKDIDDLRSREGYLYAGIPYFKGLFGRDSLITSWQLLKYDVNIARSTLKFLARYQGKKINWKTEEAPGKILHLLDYTPHTLPRRILKLIQRTIQGLPYYGSIDSTPLFVIVAGEYFRETEDRELLDEL